MNIHKKSGFDLYETEQRLTRHAKAMTDSVKSPDVDYKYRKEEICIMKKKGFRVSKITVAAAAICALTVTAAAAFGYYLSAGEAASRLGRGDIARLFEDEPMTQTVSDGKYMATVLGVAETEEIAQYLEEGHGEEKNSYCVVAVEKCDGTEITYDDVLMITPLSDGAAPWERNIAHFGGGYSQKIVDGVLYRMIECDSIAENFGTENLYIAVTDMPFIDNLPFSYDNASGKISENKAYDGTNILFEIELG